MFRARTRLIGVVATVVCALLFTACGSPADDKPASSAVSSGSSTAVTGAIAAVDAAYKGSSTAPPTSGPTPAKDKTVWVLSAFQQIAGLAYLTEQSVNAATALGWTAEVCDGQNNADGGWARCVRQAVSAGADAIVLESIDCAPVSQALAEARAAGVLIASLTSFDCDDPTQGGGAAQFDVTVPAAGGLGVADVYEQQGRLRADWVIAKTEGAARVLHVEFRGVAFGEYLADAFNKQMATCGGCKIVGTVVITPADIPTIRQKFETALLKAPDANAVAVDVDFMLAAGIEQALSTSPTDLAVAGGECSQDSIGYLHAGDAIDMCIGESLGWLAYAGMDGLNRAFAGQEVVDSGIGLQLVDADHNLAPKGSQYEGPVDYAAAYKAAWGV